MGSIWELETEIKKRPVLKGDIRTDAVIIGAGLAGVLTAYKLKKAGIRSVILEMNRIGSGQSGRTTAKITYQHDLIYDKLIKKYGREIAGGYGMANQEGLEEYKQMIREENIDCDFEIKDSYLYTHHHLDKINRELEAMSKLGLKGVFAKDTDLPFEISGAVKVEEQGQFHPLKFIRHLADDLKIYEKSRVISVKEGRVRTKDGSVTADHIVIAAHYPFINFPGYYFPRLHQERSYATALTDAGDVNGMYLSVDDVAFSFRNHGEYLILGGGGHRSGDQSHDSAYRLLDNAGKNWYPGSKKVCSWSAQDCMPAGAKPYIGRYSSGFHNTYVLTGFQKWGMSTSMAAANIISDQIQGRRSAYEQVFRPDSDTLKGSAAGILVNGGVYTKSLLKRLFYIPGKTLNALPKGRGSVVTLNGRKAGVYRDQDGRLFIVSVTCPHLGCQLEWNQDELSWDCPCHGSRFDIRGRLLDNPALSNLPGKVR